VTEATKIKFLMRYSTMNIQTTRKRRVLMVTPRYFPYMGGTETHVHEVGRRLVQDDIDVTILTTMPQDDHAPGSVTQGHTERRHAHYSRSDCAEKQ